MEGDRDRPDEVGLEDLEGVLRFVLGPSLVAEHAESEQHEVHVAAGECLLGERLVARSVLGVEGKCGDVGSRLAQPGGL